TKLEFTGNSQLKTSITEKFFAVSSLLFLDEEFEKDFQIKLDTVFDPEKVEIHLADLILEVPKIHLKTLRK
ncbi:MAG: hypothetical protein HC817_15415, partial [Saprospiraceae bacterium]|nr:hypothetical protein [Saprospiraceae bacterium]